MSVISCCVVSRSIEERGCEIKLGRFLDRRFLDSDDFGFGVDVNSCACVHGFGFGALGVGSVGCVDACARVECAKA